MLKHLFKQSEQDLTDSLTIVPNPSPLDRADEDWVVLQGDRHSVGRCSLWWTNPPIYPNHRVGLIGHYQAQTATVADLLLNHACHQLAMQGCTLAIGPMDGNSWQRYRCVTERGTEPPFFLEPDYADETLHQFVTQGFTPIAHYESALNLDLTYREARSRQIQQRLQTIGVTIRTLDMDDLDTELQQLYRIVTICFRHNFLYQPIPDVEFLAQYKALLPYINPNLVFVATHHQQVIGFLFAVPDWLEVQRGDPLQTVILKTAAVLPQRAYAGLGQILFEQCHATAYSLGFRRAIYALIHQASQCRNLTHRYARTMRRYALLGKVL